MKGYKVVRVVDGKRKSVVIDESDEEHYGVKCVTYKTDEINYQPSRNHPLIVFSDMDEAIGFGSCEGGLNNLELELWEIEYEPSRLDSYRNMLDIDFPKSTKFAKCLEFVNRIGTYNKDDEWIMIGYKVVQCRCDRLFSFWLDIRKRVYYEIGKWVKQPSSDKPLFVFKSLKDRKEWWGDSGVKVYRCEYIPSNIKEVKDEHDRFGFRRTPDDYGTGTAFASRVKLLEEVGYYEY